MIESVKRYAIYFTDHEEFLAALWTNEFMTSDPTKIRYYRNENAAEDVAHDLNDTCSRWNAEAREVTVTVSMNLPD